MFDLIRRNGHGRDAVLCAFDLIELDAEDLRRLSDRSYVLLKLIEAALGLAIIHQEV